jgi:oligopeptidase B
VKNLAAGELLTDVLPNVTENLVWANDDKTLFYAKQDQTTLRQYQIYRHEVGSDPANDTLVFEEDDETFVTYIFKSKSKRFLIIVSAQTVTQEYRYLDADNPAGEFTIFLPREREHEYHIDHLADNYIIRTNWEAKNFRLMTTPLNNTAKENWQEIVAHREHVYLSDFDVFQDYLVLEERTRGLTQIRVLPCAGGDGHYLEFEEPSYRAHLGANP